MGWFDDVFESVSQAVSSAVQDIEQAGLEIDNALGIAANDIEDWAGSVASDLEDIGDDIEKAISEAASDVEDFVEEVGHDIATGAESAGKWIDETADDALEGIEDFFTKTDADNEEWIPGPVYIPNMEHIGAGPTATQTTPDRQSRVKCNTGQYDQVVAISEAMLNAQLENYFWEEEKMQTMIQRDPDAGNINAIMRPPRVSIAVKDQNRSSLDYHIRIESATIDTSGKSIETVSASDKKFRWKIENWEFVFRVDIAFADMTEADKKIMGPKLRVAGDYSIQRLLIQFGSADLAKWNPEKSFTKMKDGADPPESIKGKLARWTSNWLASSVDIENRLHGIRTDTFEVPEGAELLDDGGNPIETVAGQKVVERVKTGMPILYHAMPPDPKKVNPVNPTFPPQAVTQQTYEFVRPDDGKGGPFRFKSKDLPDKPGTKEQITRYNCLLYLETCGRELPSSLNFDETHSNFVTADGIDINHYPSNLTAEMLATPQIMGSMCFRAEILFDGFLIPKFRPLVKETEIVIDSVSANANKKNEDLAFDWKYAFGGNTVHPKEDDVYFNMTRQTGTDDVWDKWFNNRVDGIKNTTGWRWVINEQLKQDSSVESDCWSWTAKRIWLKLTARSLCNLQHFPGTNQVRFTGVTTMVLHMKDDRNCWFTADEDQVAITGIWSFDMFFKCGESGRVEIEVDWPANPLKETDWVDPHGDHLRGISTEKIKKDMQEKLKDKVNALKTHVEQIKNALKDQCFVLSGGGYFFQRNPIFTDHGDLLVELEYKGIPKDGSLSPPPELGIVHAQPNVLPSDINVADAPQSVGLKVPAQPLKTPTSKDTKDAPKDVLSKAPQDVKDQLKQDEKEAQGAAGGEATRTT